MTGTSVFETFSDMTQREIIQEVPGIIKYNANLMHDNMKEL